jgi:hypothetical protein
MIGVTPLATRPKIPAKLRKAVQDAIADAFLEITEERIPSTLQSPPDNWVDDEREMFDLLTDFQNKIERRLAPVLNR